MSKVHIVCPNPTTVMKRVKDSVSKDELYQNLWIVSRDSYKRCNTDYNHGDRNLFRCISPLTLKYYTLVFQRYSAVYDQVFIPGKEYYFIATSDGSRGSLYRTSGGNCQHRNMKLRIIVCVDNKDPRCSLQRTATTITSTTTTKTTIRRPTSTNATTKIASTAAEIQATVLSTNPGSTILRTTNSITHAPVEEVRLPTTLPTSKSSPSVVTKKSTKKVTQTVLARASSGDKSISKHRSLLVSEMNWIIIVPLVACLLLSLIGNMILICRLRLRQNEYDLNEKDHKIVEAVPVKHLEPPKIESRIDKPLLLFRRSEDVTEVWSVLDWRMPLEPTRKEKASSVASTVSLDTALASLKVLQLFWDRFEKKSIILKKKSEMCIYIYIRRGNGIFVIALRARIPTVDRP